MPIFALVEIKGKQYKVGLGQELVVDSLGKSNGKVVFDKVLLLVEDSQVKIGTPTISGASVIAKVLGEEKGEKLYVIKFRAKSRYRRKKGFRAALTRIRIEDIKVAEKEKVRTAKKASSKK